MSTNTAQLIPENPNETLDRQINETKRFVRDIDFFLSFFSLLTILLAVLFLAVLADHWLFTDGLSMFLRVGVFFVLLFIIAFHVYRRIVPLLLYPINPVYVASLLEESRPSLKNSIVNWILLRKERFEQENHYNDKLAERIFDGVAKTAVSGVKGISSERAVDLRGLTRWGIALTLCFLFFVAYATFSPKSPLTSLTRIMLPISNIERPQAVRFLNIEPGNTVALQGEKLTVSAEVVGQSNEPVYLFFSTDDGQAVRQAIPMSLPEGKTRYEVLFPPGKQGFAGNVDYWIAQNDSRSGTFRIEVRPTASVEIVSLKYRFPPYTGLPDETLENSGDIRAIEGTEVKIGVRSTIPLQRIDLVFDNDPVKTVGMKLSDVNPLEATAAITLKLDPQNSNPTTIRNFSFRAIDQEGYESRRSGIFRLEVLPDQPPMVQWADTNTQLKDVAQLDLPLNSSLELPIQAEDRDFGLRYLRFHVESGNKQIRPAELLESPATGPTEYKGSIQRKAVFSPITSRLAEGDSAEIWAEAVDTKFPDPNNATTRRITVRIVAPQKQEQPPKENEKNSDDNKEKQNKEQDKEQNKDKNSDKNNDKEQNKNNEKEQQETKQQEQEKNQRSQDSADNREQNGRSNDKRSEKSENNKEEDNSGEENNKENGKEQNKEKNSGKNGENNGENDERQKSEETQNGWNEGEQSKESDTQGNSNEPSHEPSNTNENTSGNNNDKTENNNSVKNSAKDSAKNDDGKENSGQENENPSSKDDRQNGISKKAINPETQDGDAMEEILKQMKKEGKFDDKKLDNQTNNEQNANKQTGNDQKDNNQNRSQQKNNDQSSKQAESNQTESNQTEPKQADSTPDSKPEPRDQKEQNPDKQGSEKQDESGLGQENSQPNEANQTDTKNTEQTNANDKEQSSGQSGQKDNSKGEKSGDQQSNDSASEFSKKQGNDRKSGDQAQDVPVDSADNAPRQRDDSLDPNSKERSNQGGNSDNPQKSDTNTPSNSASGGNEGKTQTGQQEQSNQQTQSSEQGKTVDKNENGIEKQNSSQEKGTENKQAGDNQTGDNQNGNNQSGEKQNGNNQSGNNQKGEKQNSATKSGQSDENKSGAGQSKELNSGESGNSNESGSDQSDFNQSDLPKGENSAAGKNQKNQSGKPSPDSTSNTSPTGGQGSSALNIETLPEDANLEYTKKITNLVLEYLEDQLKTKPNQELLDNLGWTEKDLRDFHRKWQEMSEQSKHPESNTANDDAQWKEAFKSLGLKPSQDRQQLQKSRTEVQDKNKVTESQRFTPPSAIKDRFKRYTEGIGK